MASAENNISKRNIVPESSHLTLFKLVPDQKDTPQEKAHAHSCCGALPLEMLKVEVCVVQDQGEASGHSLLAAKFTGASKKLNNQDKYYLDAKVKNKNKFMMNKCPDCK